MKKLFSIVCIALLSLSLVACRSADKTEVLNVYNWGEYISDGSEGCMDVNAEFEQYYYELTGKRVRVNYTTFASNEDMYNKLRSGAATYDIVVPSEYMIERMIAEDMLLPLNFDNIPNFDNIDPNFKNLFYDPKNAYTVPYTFGMVGMIYNETMVDEEDLDGSWDLMWNEKYKGKILQFNNSRDGFGTAMYKNKIDVNTTNHAELDTVLADLKAQKPLVQSYVMDEIFNKMKTGSAAIAPYYAGDFLSMYEDNDSLAFYYPAEGTNVFVDAFCIPNTSRHKELAEAYINYMLSEEPAVANAEYTYYASPNLAVRENEEYIECMEDIHPDAMDILYPAEGAFVTSYYHTLDADTLAYTNELWEELKIESSIEPWILIVSGAIVLGLLVLLIASAITKRYRAKQY